MDDHCKLTIITCLWHRVTNPWDHHFYVRYIERRVGGGGGGGGYVEAKLEEGDFEQPRFGKYFIKTILVK